MKLPQGSLDNHIGILGKTGSGKTYTGKGLVEHLLDAGKRVCIVDPTGVWWGMRLKADGKSPAYDDLVIFGGQHADVDIPDAAGAGTRIGELIATRDMSGIVDTRLLTVTARTRLFTELAETIARLNQAELYLVIDEAHLFAPQAGQKSPQAANMLHAANNLVSGGRALGIRVLLLSQRPAKLHKDSLTQVETLIAMRLISPQDTKAVDEWVKDWATPGEAKDLKASLPKLETGHGWVWAPLCDHLELTAFPKISTYDSSSPPDTRAEVPSLPPLQDEDLKDVASLFAREDEPAKASQHNAAVERLKAEIRKTCADVDRWKAIASAATKERDELQQILDNVRKAIGEVKPSPLSTKVPPASRPPKVGPRHAPASSGASNLPKAQRKVLSVLAQYGERSKRQVALQTGYAIKGGGFQNALGALRTAGYITGSSSALQITQEGADALGPVDPLPAGRDLLEHWCSQLPKAAGLILRVLHQHGEMSKEDIAAATGYEATGGGFQNALGKLRTLELIHGRGPEPIRIDEAMF